MITTANIEKYRNGDFPLRIVCNFEQKNKQMNYKNNTINQIHYTL